MAWPSHDLTTQQTSRHQNTSLQSTKHHHHGTAEGSFTAKKWFGHRAGRSPCAHSIGKFFLCYIVLFLLETSAPGLSGHYWYITYIYQYVYTGPSRKIQDQIPNHFFPSEIRVCIPNEIGVSLWFADPAGGSAIEKAHHSHHPKSFKVLVIKNKKNKHPKQTKPGPEVFLEATKREPTRSGLPSSNELRVLHKRQKAFKAWEERLFLWAKKTCQGKKKKSVCWE